MDIMDGVRLRIKEYCQERNLTVTGLASLCGVTQSTVENITSSRYKSANLATIKKICDGLEVQLCEFFDRDYFNELDA